ncbi:MAG TPA: glycosyltransferase family 87 protein [Actinocrinis sp.]|jgi:uncharacterized membrane protein
MAVHQVVTRPRLLSAALPAAGWAWTRAVLFMFLYQVLPYASHSDVISDVRIYNDWSQVFGHGHYPIGDVDWQYPPAAAVVITLPRIARMLTGVSYYTAFYALMFLADFLTFLMVVYSAWRTAERRGEPRADYVGSWVYVVAIFMIGPIVFGRFDVAVTLFAVAGLVLAGRNTTATWRWRGLAVGVGAALKIWPAALLVGLPKRRDGRLAMLWAVVGAAVPTLLLAALLPGAFSFLNGQGGRGLEIESIPATPFMIARMFGYHAQILDIYGSWQIVGTGTGFVADACIAATVAGFAWLLWWRRRASLVPGRWSTGLYYDAALVAVMIAIATSRVLSPQYLVWIVALIALCLNLKPLGREGTSLTGPCWLMLAAVSVTQLDFPLTFSRIIHHNDIATWFLAARNTVLLAAAVWAAVRLWRAVVPAPVPASVLEPVTREGEQTAAGSGTGAIGHERLSPAASTSTETT